ncbi:hypothetical protein [Undibacterium baiyunense]|nr:hypothetical protein [Undibacterium baiyunense]
MQRRLVMLLCLRCSNTLVTLHDDEIAFALRIDETELAQTKELFLRKGFIDSTWEIQNWDKRQFVSDSSAPRVAKHRAAKKEAQNQAENECNVTVTPQIQNRTDTEQIQNKEEIKPSAKAQKFDFTAKLIELGADEKSVRDWLAVRKLKRAANTETVIENLVREAAKAQVSVADAVLICATRSWQGFEAEWLKPKAQASPVRDGSKLGVHGQATANAAQKWLESKNAG